MLAFSNDYYGFIFRATQSVELFCAYRKAVVLDIRIILVNSVLHAKQKGFAEQAVHTNLLTNAACALNAPYIVLIL